MNTSLKQIIITIIMAAVCITCGAYLNQEQVLAKSKKPAKAKITEIWVHSDYAGTYADINWKKQKNVKKFQVIVQTKKNGKWKTVLNKVAKQMGKRGTFYVFTAKDKTTYRTKIRAVAKKKGAWSSWKTFKSGKKKVVKKHQHAWIATYECVEAEYCANCNEYITPEVMADLYWSEEHETTTGHPHNKSKHFLKCTNGETGAGSWQVEHIYLIDGYECVECGKKLPAKFKNYTVLTSPKGYKNIVANYYPKFRTWPFFSGFFWIQTVDGKSIGKVTDTSEDEYIDIKTVYPNYPKLN